MENENKWEYDYSASNNETGYPNVGSSGMNTANQYNEPEAQPVRPAYTAPADGGSVPPTPPEQPQYSAPAQPEKPRRKPAPSGKGRDYIWLSEAVQPRDLSHSQWLLY